VYFGFPYREGSIEDHVVNEEGDESVFAVGNKV
jgi:hypothetical protein